MTFQDWVASIIDDPGYRESVVARARTGTLPPDVELFLLEMADGRLPVSAERPGPPTSVRQSKTLALVRPSASVEEGVLP